MAWLDTPTAAEAFAYWRGRLSGIGAVPLVTFRGRPRPAYAGLAGGRRRQRVASDLHSAIDATPSAELFTRFTAAVLVALAQASGRAVAGVMTAVANRADSSVAALVGWLSNTCVLVSHVEPSTTYEEVRQSVQNQLVDALDYGSYPYHELVRRLAPRHYGAPRAGVSAYVSVEYGATRSGSVPETHGGLRLTPRPTPIEVPLHGMRIMLEQDADGAPALECWYEADWLDTDDVDGLLRSVASAYCVLTRAPDTTIDADGC